MTFTVYPAVRHLLLEPVQIPVSLWPLLLVSVERGATNRPVSTGTEMLLENGEAPVWRAASRYRFAVTQVMANCDNRTVAEKLVL
jgi:hypothetical protein